MDPFADASAALEIIARRGIGKAKRLDTSHLWVQEAVARRAVELKQVHGTEHPADLMTKELNAADFDKYVDILRAEFQKARAEIVSQVATNEVYRLHAASRSIFIVPNLCLNKSSSKSTKEELKNC